MREILELRIWIESIAWMVAGTSQPLGLLASGFVYLRCLYGRRRRFSWALVTRQWLTEWFVEHRVLTSMMRPPLKRPGWGFSTSPFWFSFAVSRSDDRQKRHLMSGP